MEQFNFFNSIQEGLLFSQYKIQCSHNDNINMQHKYRQHTNNALYNEMENKTEGD